MLPVPDASLPASGYLFGQIRRRVDALAVLHAEIGQKYHLQPIAYIRIAVHHIADRGDQFDHELGQMIAGRRLAAENEGARLHLERWIGFDAVIQRHDVQHLQVLALVLVDALHQNVENRIWIDRNAGALQSARRQFLFVGMLDVPPAGAKLGVLGQRFQAP